MKQDAKPFFAFPSVMVLALYMTVLGYMIPAIRAAFSLSLAQAGFFSTMQSIGAVVSAILCFCVFPALNKARVMALCAFLLAVCMLLFGVNTFVFVLYALFFFIGLFANITDTLSNAIIADLAPHKTSFIIGLLHALWASAGAAGPFFAMMLGSAYSPVFIGLGILTALTALLFVCGLRAEIRAPFMQSPQSMGALKKLLATFKKKGVALFVATNFFSSFAQISFMFFLSSFGAGIRGIAADGAFVLSAMFLGIVIGRVVYANLLGRLPVRRVMPALNALAIVAFTAMLFCGDIVLVCLLAGVGGFGFAANFPLLIVELCGLMPQDSSAASSLVFLGFAVASFVAPPLVGAVGDTAGLGTALLISTAMLIPVVIISAMLRGSRDAAPAGNT